MTDEKDDLAEELKKAGFEEIDANNPEEMFKKIQAKMDESLVNRFGEESFKEFVETRERLQAKYPLVDLGRVAMLTGIIQMNGFGNNDVTMQCLRFIADTLDSPVNRRIREISQAEEKPISGKPN